MVDEEVFNWFYAEVLAGDFETPCAELDALAEELALHGVPFRVQRMRVSSLYGKPLPPSGWQLVYPCGGAPVSVIWSFQSYGHQAGLLEAWDFDDRSDPLGWMDAGEVLRKWPPEVDGSLDYI